MRIYRYLMPSPLKLSEKEEQEKLKNFRVQQKHILRNWLKCDKNRPQFSCFIKKRMDMRTRIRNERQSWGREQKK